MELNPLQRQYFYKGYFIDYTGVPDAEYPIALRFSNQLDTYCIIISGSISPFLTDAVAEAIINQDNGAIADILEKSGLKKEKSQFSARVEMELMEIFFKKRVRWR